MKSLVTNLIVILLLATNGAVHSQSDDPVLFTVADNPVHLSEFNYIYKKNNGDKADYSEASVEEYLDLYTKFKLKVQKAKSLKLDTIKALKDELGVYRQQLADSYLEDKEVIEKVVDELYERKQKDLKVSHILFAIAEGAPTEDKMEAIKNLGILRSKIDKGAPFTEIAKTMSDDKASAINGGSLGWMTAMLPDGFYEFENAIYSLKPGKVSQPIATKLGYHLVKVHEERPARGEVEVSHILIRKRMKGNVVDDAKSRIDSLYNILLKDDSNFGYLAKNYSEDRNTAGKEGYLGFFGISQYEEGFENTAFALQNKGDISAPVETSIGWHILKLIGKKDYTDKDKAARSLRNKIQDNERYKIVEKTVIESIQKEAKFSLNKDVLNTFAKSQNQDFYSYKWSATKGNNSTLFSIGNTNHTVDEFAEFCKGEIRTRIKYNKQTPVTEAVNDLYEKFATEKTIAYEEANLEEKYPEFKALMREYSEGILLFEVTKKNVWDIASSDTLGLRNFYNRNKANYKWNERGVLSTYTVHTEDQKKLKNIKKDIKKKSPSEILKKYNGDITMIEHKESKHEIGSKEFLGFKFNEGEVLDPVMDKKKRSYIIKKIERVMDPAQKTMGDARGYIIADYQDELEEIWIQSLKQEFPIQINDQVLQKLIRN